MEVVQSIIPSNIYENRWISKYFDVTPVSCCILQSSIFHPYISLHDIDILENMDVRSFLLGANNMLFKQKKALLDAVIEEDDTGILIRDAGLRKQLSLTSADLRFIESLRSRVNRESTGNIYDGTGKHFFRQCCPQTIF